MSLRRFRNLILVGVFSTAGSLYVKAEEQIMSKCETYEKSFAVASNALYKARSHLEEGSLENANALLTKGIEVIGDRYFTAGVLDDSSTKLALADIEESKGQLRIAANLRHRILEERLNFLSQKINDSECLK